jgi:hypothetical protein
VRSQRLESRVSRSATTPPETANVSIADVELVEWWVSP